MINLLLVSLLAIQTQADIQEDLDAGGTVVLPAGITEVDYVTGLGCLFVHSNTIVEGHPDGSTLKLRDGAQDFSRILGINDAENVTLRNFSIDGNRDNQDVQGEHRAGIWINNSSNIHIHDLTIENNEGDGIQSHIDVNNQSYENLYLNNNGRSGIALTGYGIGLKIKDCVFENTDFQAIDHEGFQFDQYYDGEISGCEVIEYPGKPHTWSFVYCNNYLIRDNKIQGMVNILWSKDVRFVKNEVYDGLYAIYLNYNSDNVLIADNKLSNWDGDDVEVVYARGSNHGNHETGGISFQSNLKIVSNEIDAGQNSAINLYSGKNVVIASNEIDYQGDNYPIIVKSTVHNPTDITISGNEITNPNCNGMLAFSGHLGNKIIRATVAGNSATNRYVGFCCGAIMVDEYIEPFFERRR